MSGIASHPSGDHLLLTFGVNDCEAKMGLVELQQIGQMLRALPGEESALCRPGRPAA